MSRIPKPVFRRLAALLLLILAGRAEAQPTPSESIGRIAPGSGLPPGVIQSFGTVQHNLGTFDINLNPGTMLAGNAAALAAFQRGADRWMSRISDSITVNINADLRNLGGGGIIGQASSALVGGSYNTIRNAMVADGATDPTEAALLAALPTAAQFSAFLPPGFTLNGNINLTTANAKALGLINATAGIDAVIEFNSNFQFDFDNRDGVTSGFIDFESVAAHEIGHALGFISAVDVIDGSTAQAIAINPLDLFRFENNVIGRDPSTLAEFTSTPRFLIPGRDAIFDDLVNEFRLSTGVSQGDGRQASHWKDDLLTGTYIGVMDPTTSGGVITLNTEADFRAMSLIGYNVVPVPEPASVALFGVGTLAILGYARRTRARVHAQARAAA